MGKAKRRVPVSERALVQRINRALAKDEWEPPPILKKTRGARALVDLGEFYVIDQRRNLIVEKDVDLERYGRELGALEDWEELAEEKA